MRAPTPAFSWNRMLITALLLCWVLLPFMELRVCAASVTEVEDATLHDGAVAGDSFDTVSAGDSEGLLEGPLASEEDKLDVAGLEGDTADIPVVYASSLDEFLQEPLAVDRYQYEILKRLEFIQYALAILISLIFVLIFKRK